MGRSSRLFGEPSSHETENRIVGPMARMIRYPAQVISVSRKRCQAVKRPEAAVPVDAGIAVAGFTRIFYRGSCETHRQPSQSMQIGKQIIELLLIQHLTERRHFIPAHLDDITDAIVIGRHPAHRKIFFLEKTLHARSLASPRRIRLVTAVTVIVVKAPPGSLLRIEPEFDIAPAALHITGN